jgi:hypothetical protein
VLRMFLSMRSALGTLVWHGALVGVGVLVFFPTEIAVSKRLSVCVCICLYTKDKEGVIIYKIYKKKE